MALEVKRVKNKWFQVKAREVESGMMTGVAGRCMGRLDGHPERKERFAASEAKSDQKPRWTAMHGTRRDTAMLARPL